MSFSNHRNNDPTSENVEQEDKVNVEETLVNLDSVKREVDEEELEFECKQYKIALTFENVFEESLAQQRINRDSLIDFLDGDVIMEIETGTVKLEDVKEENKDLVQKTIEKSHCNKCDGSYQGYCLNCSSLSHILNNCTPNLNPKPVLNTTPINVLEIREVSMRQTVFALKTLPKGIILGPFEGLAPIESTTGFQWKIKDKKLVNDQNGNWMKYIQSVANPLSRNLDVFQIDGILYLETSREIHEGEELLVSYCETKEEMLKSDNEAFYLVPVKKEGYPTVFACTLCCLGFRLENCLVEHKSKCPHGVNIEDFEIIQCRGCKVWLEKEEYLENHMLHCRVNYNKSCRNLPDFPPTCTDDAGDVYENDEITTSIDVNPGYSTLSTQPIDYNNCFSRTDFIEQNDRNVGTIDSNTNEKEYKCSECSYQTNDKRSFNRHLGTHSDLKRFQCDICKQRFGRKDSLNVHIKNNHSNTNGKEYKCSECSYQTNYKYNLKTHLDTHRGIKHFQCAICKQRFGRKTSLKLHIKNKHLNTNEKEYKCPECSYQTNDKSNLKVHLGTHVMNFQCDICKQRFTQKGHLTVHIKNKHSNANEKEYKCSECSYQTNLKSSLKTHLATHSKHFQCDICKQRFTQKGNLNVHIKDKHSNTKEKEYKCSECPYQTNRKADLKNHLVTHTDIKQFQCDICKERFGRKDALIMHIKNKHSNTNEKEYKCSECSYQTNWKSGFKIHLDRHNDIKHFQCDICKQRFTQKFHLRRHIKNKH